jgi:hypothetical protein
MAEERTLGLARAPEQSTEELSKEALQRRMDEARDSISNTVTEIKETVAHQVQAVKDTLDWREQFRKRPLIWSAGAFGVGFLVGCRVADMVKSEEEPTRDYYGEEYRSYAAQPVLSQPSPSIKQQSSSASFEGGNGHGEDKGPGLFDRLTHTAAYDRVKDEVGDIGNNLIHELTQTAKTMVIPAIIMSLKNFLGEHLPQSGKGQEQLSRSSYDRSASATSRSQGGQSSYQPELERNSS